MEIGCSANGHRNWFSCLSEISLTVNLINSSTRTEQEISLTQRDFAVLRAMTSWATCGSRDRPVGGEKNPHSTEDNDAQPLPR